MGIRGKVGALVGGLVAVAAFSQGQAQGQASVAEVRGAGSCSATACHGGARPGPGKVLRNELTVWLTRDRHADAYGVLTEERSRAIEARLSGGRLSADKDERCLACHATPVASPADRAPAAVLSDGVGCESCHGPSGRWIGEHTRWDWSSRTPQDKARFGMTPMADLASRARVCAGCHVGEPARDGRPARDVNHDLIAAGHPRLNFEFSAYLANLTHHWRDDVGLDGAPDFQARGWAIGQVVTARAALDLLRDRARRAGAPREPAAWPEFAEFGCFSCHHDLRDDPWRRQAREAATTPGRNRWGSWHFPMLETLADADTDPSGKALGAELANLRRLMDGPRPDPAEVVLQAGVVSDRLGALLDRLSGQGFDAATVETLLSRVSALQDRGAVRSWDEATQRYLALVPLSQALQMLGAGRERTKGLTRLRDALAFPPDYNSPKSFDPTAAPGP